MDGNQVPQELVTKVGEIFETILEEVGYLFTAGGRKHSFRCRQYPNYLLNDCPWHNADR